MENTQTQETTTPKKKNILILKWLLVIGITIVLNLFFNYAIKVAYNEPKYDSFCPQKQVTVEPQNQNACLAEGGAWTEYNKPINVNTSVTKPEIISQQTGYCDLTFTCRQGYENASSVYNRNVFIVLVILGVLSLVVAFFVSNISAVSLGLSFGGVLSLIIASMRYWSDMNDYLRLITLGLALVILVVLGIKKIRD